MSRIPIRVAVLVACLAALADTTSTVAQQPAPATPAQGNDQQQPPVFRGGTNFVVVDAYPQRDGKIVEGLTAADFQVLEDGRPQAIDSFEFVRVQGNLPESARRDPNNVAAMLETAADPHNRVFVAYLDALHTQLEGANRIQQPLIDTLNTIVGENDLFGVMTPNMRPRDLTLARRMLSVEEQLTKYWTWGERNRLTRNPGDPMEDALQTCYAIKYNLKGNSQDLMEPWIVEDGPVKRRFDEFLIERRREDRTLGVMEGLLDYLTTLRETRTALLLISDGWVLVRPRQDLEREASAVAFQNPAGQPQFSAAPDKLVGCQTEALRLLRLDNANRFEQLIERARRTNVAFYPIATTGLSATDAGAGELISWNSNAPASNANVLARDSTRMRDRVQVLRTMAENTGGIAVVSTNDLAGGVRRIVDDTSAYYLLGYYSTDSRQDGRLRRIEVKLSQPGVDIRARRYYVANRPAARAPGSAGTADAAPVGEALTALPAVGAAIDVQLQGAATGPSLLVSVEVASRHLQAGGVFTRGGPVSVEVTDASGAAVGTAQASIAAGMRGAAVTVPVGDAKGPWQLRARVGTGIDAFDVRGTASRASTAVLGAARLYRALPSPRAPLQPAADPQFSRSERMRVEFALLSTPDARSARVLDGRGQPLPVNPTVTELPPPADSTAALAVDVNFAPFAEGDYVLEVTAGSGGTSDRRLVAFRVVR